MLTVRLLSTAMLLAGFAVPAVAQDFAPHRAVYSVITLDKGKPGDGVPGTYAYELRLTCDGYVVNQRLRLEIPGARGMVVSEQQSQMTESRDGKKLHFEHRSTTDGRQTSLLKGDARWATTAPARRASPTPRARRWRCRPARCFPWRLRARRCARPRRARSGFDALFFYGEKVKPPQSVNMVIGKVPKRLAEVKIPDGAEQLADGRSRIYYRAA